MATKKATDARNSKTKKSENNESKPWITKNNENSRTIAVSALIQHKQKKLFNSIKTASCTSSNANDAFTKKINSTSTHSVTDFFPLRRLENNYSYRNVLDARDRSFAKLLVATVDRRMGQIDSILSLVASGYPPKKGKFAPLLQSCLRVGAAQLLFLDVPPHAAIKETVDVLKFHHDSRGNRVSLPLIKYLNAVLRSISRESKDYLLSNHSKSMNIEPWLLKDWGKSWGMKRTELIIEQIMKEPYIDVSIKLPFTPNPIERTEQLKKLRLQFDHFISNQEEEQPTNAIESSHTEILPHGMIRIKKKIGAVHLWPLYDEGIWWIQDASSALPAMALCSGLLQKCDDKKNTDIPSYLSQLHVVDMCSAPGGKCAQLLSAGIGHVTAIESNSKRSKKLIQNLDRLGFVSAKKNHTSDDGIHDNHRCSVVVSEGQNWHPSTPSTSKKIAISGILLDVPCSATGTGSRRPDVLRKDIRILDGLVQTQEALANHCVDNLLEKGGILVYATCSLLKRESEDQVHKLIGRGKQPQSDPNKVGVVETLPFLPGELPGFDDAIDENGWLRVLPGTLDGELKSCDGFFVARLIKRE